MNFTKQQVRQLRRDNARYPLQLSFLPYSAWPAACKAMEKPPRAVWRSRDFLVQAYFDNMHDRLSISRTDWDENAQRWKEGISWDEIQRLKAEAGFGERYAVEVYPADADVINVANMRHIWLLPAPPPYAWRKGAK